jgi:exoribonuclease-2
VVNKTLCARGNHALIGVILRNIVHEGRNMVQTLLADGRIVKYLPHDILYVVPKFVDSFHVERCGFEDKPVNSKELMARVSIAGKVRKFNKAAEDLFNGYAAPFNTVYPRVSSSDPEAWASITVQEAAKLLNVHHSDRSLVLHAVYSSLMKHSQMFVLDNLNFVSSQRFHVRPRSHVDRFNQVSHLLYSDSPRLRQFALRAKEIILGLRKMTENPRNQVPSYNPAPDVTFTEDDQLLIRFILDSLVDIRSIQTNPYTPFICEIIKTLGLYDGDVDSAQVRQFLVDLGVLPPWQDIASLIEVQPAFLTTTPDPTKRKQVSRPPAITSSLGPNDLYPSDLLESIRHDFGQLPVYTIDDYGAQELDDGISIERDMTDPSNLWMHVHVADPTAILPPTHSLARHARDAVQTLYFRHSSQPMLPESFVNGKLSLGDAAKNGQAENVLTFSAKVDPSGDIVDYKVRAGIIRNVRTLRYDDVDVTMSFHAPDTMYPFGRPTLSSPTPLNLSPADVENLRLLDQFSKRMVTHRLRTSTFFYGLGRPELSISPKPLPVGVVDLMQPGLFLGYPQISYAVRKATLSGSRHIVAEAAQVANRVASRFGRNHGIPLVRRALAAPVGSDEVLADLLKLRDNNGWVDFFEVRRKEIQFPLSRYTLEPAEHWVLGTAEGEGYTRATSPLRRYGDLVTHWQIKHALLHNKPLFSSRELQSTLDHIGARERRWQWIEQLHDRWWALAFVKRWLESGSKVDGYNPVEAMTGRVTAPARQDVFRGTWVQEVHVANLGLFGILEGAKTEQEIGSTVSVTIENIILASPPVLRLRLLHHS